MASASRRKPKAVPAAPAVPPSRWGVARLPLAITAASLVLGLVVVFQYRKAPFYELPILDEESYWEWAKGIAGGDVVGKKTYYQDPLYPYALAAVMTVAGHSLSAVRLLQVVLGSASVALVGWLGFRLLGPRGAWLSALLLASCHTLYFFEIQIEKSILVLFGTAVTCVVGVWASEGPKPWRFYPLGACIALLTLLRGHFLLLVPPLLAWAVLGLEGAWPRRAVRGILMAFGIGTVIVPVTVRNYFVSGELVLTTSQGGANFYIGNSEYATGRYVTLPFVRANPLWEAEDFEREAERRAGRPLTPAGVSRHWLQESMAWMKGHPGKAFRLWLHKAHLVVHDYEIPDNHSYYVTRDLFVPALAIPIFGFGAGWGLAVLGAVSLARRDPRAVFPALFAGAYALSLPPFFLLDRYRMPLLPGLSLFAAAGILWLRDRWREGARRRLAPALAGLAVASIIGFWPTVESRSPVAVEYFLVGNAYIKTGQPEVAIPFLDRALAVYPDREDFRLSRMEALRQTNRLPADQLIAEVRRAGQKPEILVRYGQDLERLGHVASAVEAYERAVTADDTLANAHARLGYLYGTAPQVRDVARGERHLRRVLELRPDDADTMNALGNLAYIAGDHDAARVWWEKVLVTTPAHAGARANLARLPRSR